VLERHAVHLAEDALDERRGHVAQRPVLLEEVHAHRHAGQPVVELASHGLLPLGPALPRHRRGGHERARDRSSARRAPQARSTALLEHHHHLDVSRAAQRLGERAARRRGAAADDLARGAGEHVAHLRVEHQPAAPLVQRRGRREVDPAEAAHVAVGAQAVGEARRLARVAARPPVDEHAGDPLAHQDGVEGLLVGARERLLQTRDRRGRPQLRALRLEAGELVVAEHHDAAAVAQLGREPLGARHGAAGPDVHADGRADGEREAEDRADPEPRAAFGGMDGPIVHRADAPIAGNGGERFQLAGDVPHV